MVLDSEPQPWSTHRTDVAFQNRWITVSIDDVALPNSQLYKYTRVDVNGVGVAVIGFNADGQVLLEREYRHGVGEVIWQVPGGLAEPEEDWVEAGLRELLEETGHAPATVNDDTVRYLGSVWDNPGLGATVSHLVAVWGLVDVGGIRRDPAEFVTLHWRSVAWVKEAIRTGKIRERTTIAAMMHLMLAGEI